MDSATLILTEPVAPPALLEHLPESRLDKVSDEKKRQIAKDFESVLLNRLLDQMKDTIGEWGFESDGPASQVQGIFWFYLAQDVANSGGLGLWKDMYQFLAGGDQGKTGQKPQDVHL